MIGVVPLEARYSAKRDRGDSVDNGSYPSLTMAIGRGLDEPKQGLETQAIARNRCRCGIWCSVGA
jgi:hypothetical protein